MIGVDWHPHPDVWALIISLVIFFEIPGIGLENIKTKRKYWYSGVLFLWVWTDWPLHDIGEQYLFSVHSAEHIVLALVVPPLLLLGLNDNQRKLVVTEKTIPFISVFAKPFLAFGLFNFVIVSMHWDTVINLMVTNSLIHFLLHSVMLLVSINMWIPVIGLDKRIKQLSYPLRIGYLFIQSLLPTIPAGFLAFSTSPLYSAYLEVNQIYNITAINDQTLAGLVLKLGGGAILWISILIIWIDWYKKEKNFSDIDNSSKNGNLKP